MVYFLSMIYYLYLAFETTSYKVAQLEDLLIIALIQDFLPIAIVFYTHFKNMGHIKKLFVMLQWR